MTCGGKTLISSTRIKKKFKPDLPKFRPTSAEIRAKIQQENQEKLD